MRLPYVLLALALLGCVSQPSVQLPPEPEQPPQLNTTQYYFVREPPAQNATPIIVQYINVSGQPPPEAIIGNASINQTENYSIPGMEKRLCGLINAERIKAGIAPLKWNDDVASVARDHSLSLARENQPLTEPSLFCKRPFIHHEGFDFGLYETDRLYNRSVFYFSAAGENIFMISAWDYALTYNQPEDCPETGTQIVHEYEGEDAAARVSADYEERLDFVKNATRVRWSAIHWLSQSQLESIIVGGWMGSAGHKANILETKFDETGIGVARVNDYFIVTQAFIERTDCGFQDAPCCEDDDGPFCYQPWTCYDDECRNV